MNSITPSIFDNIFIKILIDKKLRNFKDSSQEDIEYLCGLAVNELTTFLKIGKLAIQNGDETAESFMKKLDATLSDYDTLFDSVDISDDSERLFKIVYKRVGDMV